MSFSSKKAAARGLTSSAGNSAMPKNVVASVWNSYHQSTPPRHKVLDAFLVFNMVAGILIFVHGMLITTFPFDSWIAS